MLIATMTDDPKKAGIPPFLQVQNRAPLTADQAARVEAFFARPTPVVSGTVRSAADDAAVAAMLGAEIEDKKKRTFENRIACARARASREGRWVPGCVWDTMRGRWEHPTARWDARAQRWIPVDETGEGTTMREKKAKKRAAPKEGGGIPRDVKRPCGLVADFNQVREGTARATIARMGLDGGHTVDAVAKKIGKDRGAVMAHLHCLNRDCGYGYEVAGNKLTITLPGSKTLADAIKPSAEAA